MNFPDLPHLRQLQKDLWQWPKSRASVMVGAGLSINAEPLPGVKSRFLTWRQLVRAMFDELHPAQPDETSEQLQTRTERLNNANALRIASEYEAAFGPSKLEHLIRTQNPDSDYQPSKLHHLLLQLPWADVFTTNYDTLLERTIIPGRTYQPVTNVNELTTAFAPRILKLHGSLPSQTPFTITEENYRRYPRDFAPFVNSVQQSLLENSFVLIGFSGEDPNFLEWTGWIRDELGGNHPPIYLVGPLSLGNAERSLLTRRGVTPIDLSSVFPEDQTPEEIYGPAIEWFLHCLLAAQPPRPEKWPDMDRKPLKMTMPDRYPPIIDTGLVVPENIESSPTTPLNTNTFFKVLARWQYERQKYPGWLVATEGMRSLLWMETRSWFTPLTNLAKDRPVADRILVFRVINWRVETSMVPLFQEMMEPFLSVVNELYETIADGQPVRPSSDFVAQIGSEMEVADAWLEIAFALLRDARESYDSDKWNHLKEKIDRVVQRHPQHADRRHYEAALWAMWNVERKAAKEIVSEWQPSSRSPLAAMWKAGILAELDEPGEARTILQATLQEIRRALRIQGQNIELLSLEGWCMYLLYSINFATGHYTDEFSERWEELKAWDCSPWPHKEYFEKVLSAAPPTPQKEEQEVKGFDPGRVTVWRHWGSDPIGPYLPGFAGIRLYEQVGLPMRLPWLNVAGTALMNACRWIAPFTGFWSPALLVRAGKLDNLTKSSDFLSRTQVAAMDSTLAKRIYRWCLQILERELASLSGPITMGSAQEGLLEVLPEVLSRLAFKADTADLKKTFPLALHFHRQPGVLSHIRLNESCGPWFERLFYAADDELLLEWLPDLIRFPFFYEGVPAVIQRERVWPDPMRHIPKWRAGKAKESHADLVRKINSATDWLLKRAAVESGEGRHRAIDRLIDLHLAKLMLPPQQQQLGELLWGQRPFNNLPDRPGYAVFGFMHLPAPANVDVPSAIKQYILSLSPGGPSSQNAGDMIFEASLASKPVAQLKGEACGVIEWTTEESKQLYTKARDWWANNKKTLIRPKRNTPFDHMGDDPKLNTLKRLGDFFARAVLPHMDWANEDEWQQVLTWLQEIRGFGVFPTLAIPYILLQRPTEATTVAETILADLTCDVKDAVVTAAKATRHWITLTGIDRIPAPPSSLITALIDRVIFRRKAGVDSCLEQMAYLIFEKPEVITPSHVSLLTASLVPWHHATFLPVSEEVPGEFLEAERPDLRVLIGRLAGALKTWHTASVPELPESPSIALWRDLCESDPLPEIRRAFTSWNQFG